MLLANFTRILWARKFVFLLTFVGTVATAAALSLWLPKQYTATASLVVDFKAPDYYPGQMIPAQLVAGYMATQIDIISSQNVALKVVDDLNLDEDQALQDQLMASSLPVGPLLSWMTGGLAGELLVSLRTLLQSSEEPAGTDSTRLVIAQKLLDELSIEPSKSSGVIEVSFRTSDPGLAALVANGFAEAYLDTNLRLRVDPALRSVDWQNERIAQLRQELESAKGLLSAYQQEKGIVATEERLDVESARLSEISSQLVEARAERSDAESRLQQVEQALDRVLVSNALPEVLSNPLVQRLKAGIAEKEAVLAELSQRLDRNHPDYKRAALEVSKLRSLIRAETKSILDGIAKSAELAAQREREAQDALAAQKARLLALKGERNEAEVMLRDVENAQLAYDNAVKRLDDARNLSKANQTNVAILNAATIPLKHTSPNLELNLALASVLGILFGAGLVFVAEMTDRRIRVPGDIEDVLDAPVLGVVVRGGGGRRAGVTESYAVLRGSISNPRGRQLETRNLGAPSR